MYLLLKRITVEHPEPSRESTVQTSMILVQAEVQQLQGFFNHATAFETLRKSVLACCYVRQLQWRQNNVPSLCPGRDLRMLRWLSVNTS